MDWGIYGPDSGIPEDNPYNTWAYWESLIGKVIPIRTFFGWSYKSSGEDFINWIKPSFDQCWAAGSIPLFAGIPSNDPEVPNWNTDPEVMKHWLPTAILAGEHDAWLTVIAQQMSDWPHDFYMRFWHEANNYVPGIHPTLPNCNPWNAIVYDDDDTLLSDQNDWINAWRHIVNLFRNEGATNIKWVWSVLAWPSANYGGNNQISMASFYPGDAYVDVIATEYYTTNFLCTPANIKDDSNIMMAYNEICAVSASKDVWFAEGAALSSSPSPAKQIWIGNALNADNLRTYFPRIKATFLWDDNRPVSGSMLGFSETTACRDATIAALQNAAWKSGR